MSVLEEIGELRKTFPELFGDTRTVYYLDLSMSLPRRNLWSYVPKLDGTLQYGEAFVRSAALHPSPLVGITHIDGQHALREWLEEHRDYLKGFEWTHRSE